MHQMKEDHIWRNLIKSGILEDRYDVADYIGAFILEVYSEEIRNSRNGVCESIANSRAGKCYNVDKAVALMKQ